MLLFSPTPSACNSALHVGGLRVDKRNTSDLHTSHSKAEEVRFAPGCFWPQTQQRLIRLLLGNRKGRGQGGRGPPIASFLPRSYGRWDSLISRGTTKCQPCGGKRRMWRRLERLRFCWGWTAPCLSSPPGRTRGPELPPPGGDRAHCAHLGAGGGLSLDTSFQRRPPSLG